MIDILPNPKWFIPIVIAAILLAMLLTMATIAHAMELKASWYSVESLKKEGTWKTSHGIMANGKEFNDEGKTCASRDYPLGTKVKVTNTQNGRSVFVEVTDRIGKRFKGKRIDLSEGAFAQIADCKQGIVNVNVEVVK